MQGGSHVTPRAAVDASDARLAVNDGERAGWRREDQRFRTAFENAAVGMAHVAVDGRFQLVNRKLADIVGYSTEELLRSTFADIVYADDASDWQYATALLAGDAEFSAVEKHCLRRDGSRVWLHLTLSLVREEGGSAYFFCVIEDASLRKAAEAAVAERERRFAALADAVPQLVWINFADGTNEFVNRRWRDYTGLTPSEAQAEGAWERVLHADDVQRAKSDWERAVAAEQPYEAEFRLRRYDGVYRWFLARAAPVHIAEGAMFRWFGTCTDIDCAKHIEASLRATEAELREADERKDTFIATLAHELRNPLSPIRAAAQLLAVKHISEVDLERNRAIIARQVRHMALLLDDLLDVSRISRRALRLRKEYVELGPLLETAVETARPLLDERRHHLEVDVPKTGLRLEADPVRLTQVVSNLLTNAARYTDPGGRITLAARVEDDRVVIIVRDNGIGIEAAALPRLFEMFYQCSASEERQRTGLGIGLALVKGLVELHGGDVHAHSEGLGRGSEFRVSLPGPASATAAGDGRDAAATAAAATLRILVADDNHDGAETLGLLLRLGGHDVHLAFSGPHALEAARQYRPQVALLDIGMPGLDGYEVGRRIRSEAWGRSMRLIAVTGWGRDDDKVRALAAGFDCHLTKPLDPDSLLDVLQKVVGAPAVT